MSVILLLTRTLTVISIGLLLIYLYGMLIRRYRSELMPWENWIAGVFFGIATMLSIFAGKVLFSGTVIDGKMALLAVGVVFSGPRGAIVIIASILSAWTLLQVTITPFLISQLITVTVIGLFYGKWLNRRGYERFYGPMALLGLIVMAQSLLWSQLFKVSLTMNGSGVADTLLVLMLAPVVTLSTGSLFLMEMERREKERQLMDVKEDLMAQNEETTALYEEMSAAEEALQEQYDHLRENREEILRINDRYKLIYQAGNEGLWEYDYATKETLLSDRITEIYGYGPDQKDFMNTDRNALIHPEDLPRVYQNWRDLNCGKIESYDMEYRILHASGEYRWIQAKGIILRDENGKNVRMAGSHGDIHQKKMQEQKLYESAYYDQLTGLPNRKWFVERLEKCVAETVAIHDVGAVLVLGLDDFKVINDAMGRGNGDEVLREVACRLVSLQGEKRTVARLSGDEFLVLLSSIQQRHEIEAEINTVLELIHRPIHLNAGEIIVTSSLGAVLFPKDAHTAETILRNGDIALQQAKNHRKNGFVFFDDKMAKENMRRILLDVGLKSAFANQEFILHYQPIFKTETRELAGFEALVRWNSPEFGFVPPDEFIKLAEQNGRIVELGNWVLQEACGFLKRMNLNHNEDLYLSVNLSPVQLLQKNFVMQVKDILNESGVSADRIIFEITETSLMESFDTSFQKILILKDWGLNFSLDDFGTGYSSLNYLRSIPVKTLKIDKSFIADLTRDQRLQRMVKSIIDISHDLDLIVVTEGVEEEDQLRLLKDYGCDCIQGYLLGRPVPEAQAMNWINQPLNGALS